MWFRHPQNPASTVPPHANVAESRPDQPFGRQDVSTIDQQRTSHATCQFIEGEIPVLRPFRDQDYGIRSVKNSASVILVQAKFRVRSSCILHGDGVVQ